jgi:hypothetical protein
MVYHLAKNEVPAFLRGAYEGNKFRAEPVTSLTIQSDAGLWSGGSREFYSAVDLQTGFKVALPDQDGAPWDASRKSRTIDLRPGYAIVRSSHFCGKNMGLVFYIHPDDVAKLVPKDSGAELCDIEKKVLRIIDGYKSFARNDEFRRAGIELGEVDAIKSRLISLGLLNKAGAITVKGRNACAGVRL